ncbi:MAG TPA: hypothetical protein VIK06_05695 [Candidatus Limnocylindrales bacterium]
MRRLTLAFAVATLVATTGLFATAAPATAAGNAKVVIVVGAVDSNTVGWENGADNAANTFAQYTPNITKIYSPNATWAAVKAAAAGANILVYVGHGSGYPNPYVGYLQPNGDNGMGLNATAGNGNSNTQYYGENYMAQLALAPNAVVILWHLCYASGDSEWGMAGSDPVSMPKAQTRVDGYASGFIRGGAKAVIADGVGDITSYINGIFGPTTTIDNVWKSASNFHNHVTAWASTRNTGYTSQIDASLDNPAADGDVYYRSMVSIPSLSTDTVVSGTPGSSSPPTALAPPPFVSQTGKYFPLTPTRIIDTRPGTVGPVGAITAGSSYGYQVTGKGNVPAGAVAITANVTVTGQTASGWLGIGPSDGTPGSSTLNFPVGDDRANGITVALSPSGTLNAYLGANAGARTNFIIDVTGYFVAGSGNGYVQFGPHRILDSRPGAGNIGLSGKFVAGAPRKIQVAGVAGLPASGIVAVTGNLTAVTPSARGYAFLSPAPTGSPSSSTVNFPAGDIRANNVIVPVADDGTLAAVYMSTTAGANVDLLLDITGYFVAMGGAEYHTLAPARILDSRNGTGLPAGAFAANVARTLTVWGAGGVPANAIAITANLTVTGQTYAGFAAMGPTIDASTQFSNLNFPVGDNRANSATVPLSGSGQLAVIYVARGGYTAQLILDVSGYYANRAG